MKSALGLNLVSAAVALVLVIMYSVDLASLSKDTSLGHLDSSILSIIMVSISLFLFLSACMCLFVYLLVCLP